MCRWYRYGHINSTSPQLAGEEQAVAAGRQVGFVGLGNMGGRMTRRLVAAGFRVVGYDARAAQAASAGAVAAEALGEVCEGTEVVLLSLPDSRAVESVVLGARRAVVSPGGSPQAREAPAPRSPWPPYPPRDGLLAFARPGQV